MATIELTSASDGSIAFSDTTKRPCFVIIGDSIAQGQLGGQTGEDRQHDPDERYDCRNFNKSYKPSYSAATTGLRFFDQWMYNSSGSQWDAVGTSQSAQGRYYFDNGVSGAYDLSATLNTCRARAAADFVNAHPYTGLTAGRDMPADINVPSYDAELRDNNLMWAFGLYMALNGVFKRSDGVAAAPHFINFAVSSSAIGNLGASANLRRVSWDPTYTACAAGVSPSSYEMLNDMYLNPGITALPAGSYLAGIIVILGSNDCTERANNPSTTYHDVCLGNDIPARRMGAELVAMVDAIKTACSVTNVPVMYGNPVATPHLEPGDSSNTGPYEGYGKQGLLDAIEGDPYATTFNITSRGVSDGASELAGSGVHLSATGADRLGFRLADLYYDTFINQATALSIETPTSPSTITP